MKATYNKGDLSINVQDLLGSLSLEDKIQVIDALACESDIIKHVTAQILDGMTEHGSYGGLCVTAGSDPQWGLDWAKRQVALRAGEVHTDEIRRLVNALQAKEKEVLDLQNLLQEVRSQRQRY